MIKKDNNFLRKYEEILVENLFPKSIEINEVGTEIIKLI